MMKFTLDTTPAPKVETPCLVVGAFTKAPLTGSAALTDEASGGTLQRLIDSGDIDTSWKSTTMLHGLPGVAAERILVVGCGEADKLDTVRFDTLCKAAGAYLRDHTATGAHLCLHEVEFEDKSAHWRLRQAAFCVDWSNYRYTETRTPKDDDKQPLASASFNAGAELQAALDQAASLAKGFRRARQLGNLPPNICTPEYLAGQAREIANAYAAASVEVLGPKDMAELKMSALLAVGQGSANPPRLIVLDYRGADEDSKPYVLVGKGITFDTGGISLKPGANMEQMKFDMGGAAAIIGAFEACADMHLPINLVCIVAAAENMPDGKAYRPGDVLTSMSGKTIEILNTDAEGRLVLCDALTYSQRYEPAALIDVATLTGACVIALGHHASAIMSQHDDLADELLEAGLESVDRGWRLPLWDDYQSQLKSNFADMKNVGGQPAGSVTAGCFLSRFTEGQRWAHIDCAGSTWKWSGENGSTGRPVGLLTRYLMDRAG
ncbi:MAG: leucyl aminopeptidase [Lysobacterales bacterium]